jgi:hypothetical protein
VRAGVASARLVVLSRSRCVCGPGCVEHRDATPGEADQAAVGDLAEDPGGGFAQPAGSCGDLFVGERDDRPRCRGRAGAIIMPGGSIRQRFWCPVVPAVPW